VTLGDAAAVISLPRDMGEISPSLELIVTYHQIPLFSEKLTKPNGFILESSPVLNL